MNRRLYVLTIIALGALAACNSNGGGPSGPDAESANELAALIDDAGLGCDDFEDTTGVEDEDVIEITGLPEPVSEGTCTVDGEAVEISIYKDAGVRQNVEGVAASMGCAFGEAFGVTNFSYVVGATWTITPESQTVADSIGDEIGATSKTVECDN